VIKLEIVYTYLEDGMERKHSMICMSWISINSHGKFFQLLTIIGVSLRHLDLHLHVGTITQQQSIVIRFTSMVGTTVINGLMTYMY
jgi:hypothetical protein